MSKNELHGKSIKKLGIVEGEAVVSRDLVAFWGGDELGNWRNSRSRS